MSINSIVSDTNFSTSIPRSGVEEVDKDKKDDDLEVFWSYHDRSVEKSKERSIDGTPSLELDLYFEEPPIQKNLCAIQFWKSQPQTNLSNLALEYFSLIATSVPLERQFSKLGQIYTKNEII